MAVDDSLGDIYELAAHVPRVSPEHLERLVLMNFVAFHQNSLGALGHGSAWKGPTYTRKSSSVIHAGRRG